MNQPPDAGRRFDAVAATYDRHDFIQREVSDRLIERLDGLIFTPERIVDLGCATGRSTRKLSERYRAAQVFGVDSAPAMLARARRRAGRWRRRFDLLRADVGHLPLAESSADLVFSSLTLEWCTNLSAVLAGIRRILRPGGMILVATTGPDTLTELRRAFADIGLPDPAPATVHAMQLGDALVAAGFREPVVDTDWLTVKHDSVTGLLDDLERSGTLALDGPGRARLAARMSPGAGDEALPSTWEVVYASAWAPEPGQPIRGERGEEASIPVSSLKVRRR